MCKAKTRSWYIKKLDQVFSEFIRLRDANNDYVITCPLCGARILYEKAQNMHFIKRSVMKYRYDEDNCHAGCMRCNVILNGNYIVYTRWMQKEYGIERVDEMINDKEVYKLPTPTIMEKIDYYKKVNEGLRIKKFYLGEKQGKPNQTTAC